MFFMLRTSNIIHEKEKTESTKREWIGANRETGWSRFLKRLRIQWLAIDEGEGYRGRRLLIGCHDRLVWWKYNYAHEEEEGSFFNTRKHLFAARLNM